MVDASRRSFLGWTTASVVALGLVGCRRLEDAIAEVALGPEDGPFQPPALPTDPLERLLARATYGPRPGDRSEIAKLGREQWVERQLAPQRIDDRRCELLLGAIEPLSESRAEHFDRQPLELLGAMAASRIVRATHSKRQLLETMVECWSDHFNIVWSKGDCRWVRLADELETIRPHALGRFRDLVRASATSPAMLVYLDGHDNKVVHPGDRPNENYARELLELHTLGVDGGYTQRDIVEAARCLSGWTHRHRFWAGSISKVAFDPTRHDDGAKEVLGTRIPAGCGADDLERLIDIVVGHPATARHVARRLVRTYVADPAPEETVGAVASTFESSGGSIAQCVRVTLAAACEFDGPARPLFKRPFRFLTSALRGLGASTDGGPALLDALRAAGHAPSEYPTPDGYPLEMEPWIGSLPWRWRLASDLAGGRVRGSRVAPDRFVERAGSLVAAIEHLWGRSPEVEELALLESSGAPIAAALAGPAFQWH